MGFESAVNVLWHRAAGRFRRKRWQHFLTTFPPARVRSIVDVGGLAAHWVSDAREIVVLNLMPQAAAHCKVIVGDGRHTGFKSLSFDVAYSNSVIEHVGEWKDQVALANELRRIGRGVYCQTPNRWFPLEVHYLTCFFHWYPKLLQNYLVVRFLTGWGWLVKPDSRQVHEYAATVKLLSIRQMRELFPDCEIQKERFLGMTKSLIAVRLAP